MATISPLLLFLLFLRRSDQYPVYTDPLCQALQFGHKIPDGVPPSANASEILCDKTTLFHVAANAGDTEWVQEFLANGAPVNTVDEDGKTPLHYAASGTNHDMVMLLINSSANIHQRDHSRMTPAHEAARSVEPAILDTLIRQEVAIDAQTQNGQTPLHIASAENCPENIKTLILFHANTSAVDHNDNTPFDSAIYSHSALSIKTWIKSGAVVNVENYDAFAQADGEKHWKNYVKSHKKTLQESGLSDGLIKNIMQRARYGAIPDTASPQEKVSTMLRYQQHVAPLVNIVHELLGAGMKMSGITELPSTPSIEATFKELEVTMPSFAFDQFSKASLSDSVVIIHDRLADLFPGIRKKFSFQKHIQDSQKINGPRIEL